MKKRKTIKSKKLQTTKSCIIFLVAVFVAVSTYLRSSLEVGLKAEEIASLGLTSSSTQTQTSSPTSTSTSWCEKMKNERSKLDPNLHISYPCENIQPTKYNSAIVTFLTAGVKEGEGSRIVFEGKDYINGAIALGASLSQQLTREDTIRLLLVSDQFTLPKESEKQLEAVGWTIGKAPAVPIESKYVPGFNRYKTTYVKIAALGLSEFKCALLMDADALAVGNLDDLLSCNVFDKPEYQVAGTLDYYHKRWRHFNTGSILWKTSAQEMNRVYGLTKDESFMKRFESDQIFLNHVYPDRIDLQVNKRMIEDSDFSENRNRDGWGKVVDLGWKYNSQTHVEVQLPTFWKKHLADTKIIHYTEKKGWQCPEEHGSPPSDEVMSNLKNCDNKKRDELCFCGTGYLWWDALRKGQNMVASS
jgi:hypothetical protein